MALLSGKLYMHKTIYTYMHIFVRNSTVKPEAVHSSVSKFDACVGHSLNVAPRRNPAASQGRSHPQCRCPKRLLFLFFFLLLFLLLCVLIPVGRWWWWWVFNGWRTVALALSQSELLFFLRFFFFAYSDGARLRNWLCFRLGQSGANLRSILQRTDLMRISYRIQTKFGKRK